MIECTDITKTYGNLTALSLDYINIKQGKVTVLAGPNGSGKSTFIKILLGLVNSESGSVNFNKDSFSIGYYPESVSLPENLTARRLKKLLESLSKTAKSSPDSELGELMSMDSYMDKRIHKLSKGMHKKVGLMMAFTGNPDLVVLDEPFEGVDTIDRDKLMMYIKNKARKNTSVLLSTHILDNIDHIVDTVYFLKQGRVVCCYDIASNALSGNYHTANFDQFTDDSVAEIISTGGKRQGVVTEIYRIIFREQV
jgi:ABC-2 type transport system ATP-binding protein